MKGREFSPFEGGLRGMLGAFIEHQNVVLRGINPKSP